MDCFSAGAVFVLLLAALTKSWESCKLIPAGFSSGCGDGLNLVDFYKVSLAARDGLFFC